MCGVGIEESLFSVATVFLACKNDALPFKLLDLTVGGNHRRVIFWKPIISYFKDRLSLWNGRLLSIRGRVTLINYVLMNLPIHHPSLFKAHFKVIQEIISIQRKFLWSGSMEKSSMAWVSWNSVCKLKANEGLGIKHIGLFNKELLAKWLWRFLKESHAICSGILEHNYKSIVKRILSKEAPRVKCFESLWWRDLLDYGDLVDAGRFAKAQNLRLGD